MFSDIFTDLEQENKTGVAKNGNIFKVKPAVDIYETTDSVVVLAEMPNVERKNLKVEVENGMLHISANRNSGNVDGQYLLRETRNLFYERYFELEEDLDAQKISADYSSGILKITIGKKEKVKPRRIEIK